MSFCPVCHHAGSAFFADTQGRLYDRCAMVTCGAIYLREENHLPEGEERTRYELHDNDLSQAGYRRFLEPLVSAVRERSVPGGTALDFGCGPAASVSSLVGEGMRWSRYDKYFMADEQVWSQSYDVIAASEVFEHLRKPDQEMDRLGAVLRPGGSLVIGTQLFREDRDFSQWHYRRDPTHIVFYTRETFTDWARRRGWDIEIREASVVMLRRPN